MPGPPAARITDLTAHGSPLMPGPPSPNVLIGGLPAWLGLTAAGAAALGAVIAQGAADVAAATAAVGAASAGGPAAVAAANANLVDATATAAANTAAAMAGSGASLNLCPLLTVLVPHGVGVVVSPSATVIINNMGACRIGDAIVEVTAPNTIASGFPTVLIG